MGIACRHCHFQPFFFTPSPFFTLILLPFSPLFSFFFFFRFRRLYLPLLSERYCYAISFSPREPLIFLPHHHASRTDRLAAAWVQGRAGACLQCRPTSHQTWGGLPRAALAASDVELLFLEVLLSAQRPFPFSLSTSSSGSSPINCNQQM